jgi:formylmethanofuran--tetrahydromethanopterin N-formyltransferase
MELNGVEIEDTFAEAWELQIARILLTAASERLAVAAAQQITGAGGSCELSLSIQGGIERLAIPPETPDGRPGVIVQFSLPPKSPYGPAKFREDLEKRIILSTQIPTTSIFDFTPDKYSREKFDISKRIIPRGKGYEKKDKIDGRKVIRFPSTSGEWILEEQISIAMGCDGHFIVYADNAFAGIAATEAAKNAVRLVNGVAPIGFGTEAIMGKYPESCPTIREKVKKTEVPEGVNALITLLMSGLDDGLMKNAMKNGIEAAVKISGVRKIGARNEGGKFGIHKFYLCKLFE